MRSYYLRGRGFTVVELMVTIAIAAVLLGMAIPSFTSFLRSSRAETQSSSFVNAINYARSEAVKRGGAVHISKTVAGGGWQQGWSVWFDANGNGTFDNGVDATLQSYPAFTGTATLTGGGDLAFDSFGKALSIDGVSIAVGATTVFAYRVGAGYCSLERDITVNHLGRATITRVC